MAKAAFRVEDGIIPGHTDADLGHTAFKFRDVHMSRNTHIDGNADIGGNLDVSGSTNLENLSATGNTINLPNFFWRRWRWWWRCITSRRYSIRSRTRIIKNGKKITRNELLNQC